MDTSAATRGAVLLVGSERENLMDWPLHYANGGTRTSPALSECWDRLLPERGRRVSLRQTDDADGLMALLLNGETG